MFTDILQGKPIRHPVHPALVHFPIALFTLSFVMDIAHICYPTSPVFGLAAYYALIGGVLMGLIAAVPGLIDWFDIRADHPGRGTATTHMVLNFASVALYAISGWIRYRTPMTEISPAALILSFAGFGILMYSGYLGGGLVYDEGIAVGRHRRRTNTPGFTLDATGPDISDGSFAVAEASQLGEGGTLRVQAEGKVIMIARFQGKLFAVQEFCTHRFGPLSEGQIKEDRVICPWHRSEFDLATGRVASGPAKEDLKTYKVFEREGWIFILIPKETEKKKAA